MARFHSLVLGLVLALSASAAAHSATTETIVSDPVTGLALSGIDPVSYFIDQPQDGKDRFETQYGGVTWRFVNAGNLAAFSRDPNVYAPVFGGYDPVAIAHGDAASGHPLVWSIYHGRLYLFLTQKSQAAFLAEPDHILEAATASWPKVKMTLVP